MDEIVAYGYHPEILYKNLEERNRNLCYFL